MINTENFPKRLFFYLLGLFILAMGIAFSVASDLGISPVNSVPYVVSIILNMDLGVCATATYIVFIFVQFLLMGKGFKPTRLLQFISAIIFGSFVSLTSRLTASLDAHSFYPLQIVFCLIGVFCVALGILLYLNANIISLPGEGVTEAIQYRFNFPLHKAKITFDSSMVSIALILSMIFLGKIQGIREGTLIAAVGVGATIKVLNKIWEFLKVK